MPPHPASTGSALAGAASPADREVVAAVLRRLDRPVVLVGMMGVGKTSLGRRLAGLLGLAFVDADEAIEAAAAMTIPEIFAHFDEAYFRAGERRVIARLMGAAAGGAGPRDAAPRDAASPVKVIATGGGAFCDAGTRELILRRGIAVWLDADLDTLVERTGRRDSRPLLQGADRRATLARLQAERAALYAQAPIHVKSGNGPHQRAAMQVVGAMLDWLEAPSRRMPPADGRAERA